MTMEKTVGWNFYGIIATIAGFSVASHAGEPCPSGWVSETALGALAPMMSIL
jgi:hypothetical protein